MKKRIEIKWKLLINCSLFMEYLRQNTIVLNRQIRKITNVLIFSNKKIQPTQYYFENVREASGERLH